jgi:hypothetical protein
MLEQGPSFRLSEMLQGGSFEQEEAPWRLVETAQPRPGLGCEKGFVQRTLRARSELLQRQRRQQRGRLAASTRDSPDRIGKLKAPELPAQARPLRTARRRGRSEPAKQEPRPAAP